MIGAIVGDIVGSRFEFHNHRSKEFELFDETCFATDDSVLTVAVMKAIMESKSGDYRELAQNTIHYMRSIGRQYPECGFGGRFVRWMFSDNPQPYNSCGNGAAMRISPVVYAAKDLPEVMQMAKTVTEVTHNHPEGIKGAVVTAVCIWMALHGESKEDIRAIASEYYDLDFTLDSIRETYTFNETCQQTVPQSLVAFFESTDFEDAIRNAISIGGDSDTLAAITGSIAEAYYGIPDSIVIEAMSFLPLKLKYIVAEFDRMYKVHTYV